VEGKPLRDIVQEQEEAAQRSANEREPLHEVCWGVPVCYQACAPFARTNFPLIWAKPSLELFLDFSNIREIWVSYLGC
jgi:hypothetical protein